MNWVTQKLRQFSSGNNKDESSSLYSTSTSTTYLLHSGDGRLNPNKDCAVVEDAGHVAAQISKTDHLTSNKDCDDTDLFSDDTDQISEFTNDDSGNDKVNMTSSLKSDTRKGYSGDVSNDSSRGCVYSDGSWTSSTMSNDKDCNVGKCNFILKDRFLPTQAKIKDEMELFNCQEMGVLMNKLSLDYKTLLLELGRTVEVLSPEKYPTDEFRTFLHILTERFLRRELERIKAIDSSSTKRRKSLVHSRWQEAPEKKPYEYMILGMLQELQFIHSTQRCSQQFDEMLDSFMPNVLERMGKFISADRRLTLTDIQEQNVEAMRQRSSNKSFGRPSKLTTTPQSVYVPGNAEPARQEFQWEDYFRQKFVSQKRQHFEVNLRKTLEIGFIYDKKCLPLDINESPIQLSASTYKMSAYRKGREAGARLWNIMKKRLCERREEDMKASK